MNRHRSLAGANKKQSKTRGHEIRNTKYFVLELDCPGKRALPAVNQKTPRSPRSKNEKITMLATPVSENTEKIDGSIRALVAGMTDEEIDAVTEKVIGCAIEVHRILGPGLLEAVYRECMVLELKRQQLVVESERWVPFDYRGERIATKLKLDLLVNGCVIVELKAVERLHPVHSAQVISYLKLTGYPAGLLMNFNSVTLVAGLKRLNHPERYVKKLL